MAIINMAGVLPFCYPNEFTLFPNLPYELRLKIWDVIIAEGRVIEIGLTGGVAFDDFFTRAQLPTIFRISHESRARAFEKHQIITMDHVPLDRRGNPQPWLARIRGPPESPDYKPLKFLINFDADTLYLSLKSFKMRESRWGAEGLWHQDTALGHFMWHLLKKGGDQKLRRIAFDGQSNLVHSIGPQLERCRRLENVHMVFEDRAKILSRDNVLTRVEYVGPWDDRWNKKKQELREQIEEMLAKHSEEYHASLEAWKLVEIIPSFVRRKEVKVDDKEQTKRQIRRIR